MIVLVGVVLRFWQIGAKTVWLDEAFSIWIARHPLLELWGWLVRIDQHPPLYYSLLHGWIALFGDLQGAVRAFSALCSTLALPFFFGAARQLFDRPTALIATLLLAVSPFHVRYAQEARMYGLLTLTAAVALFFLLRILMRDTPAPRRDWLGLAVAQAAVMLTHNTATVFFPLALNLAIGGAILRQYWQGGVSGWPALNNVAFDRRWVRWQSIAVLLWLPWAIPFIRQALLVDQEFWIPSPTLAGVLETLHNFHLAFLPGWIPFFGLWDLLLWGVAGLGLYALRTRPARAWLLLGLFLTPILGELLVSLRRPIFYERTLIYVTLPYLLLIAAGLRHLTLLPALRWQRVGSALAGALLAILLCFSALGLHNYFVHFQKEDWAQAAEYVAEQVAPDDVIIFNATWVQLPFEYYFRHYYTDIELRGLPVDLFDRGVLEPKMTEADLPYMTKLLAGRRRVWLVYSHDWYTDPQQIIPRHLRQSFRQADQQSFVGLQIMRFEAQ